MLLLCLARSVESSPRGEWTMGCTISPQNGPPEQTNPMGLNKAQRLKMGECSGGERAIEGKNHDNNKKKTTGARWDRAASTIILCKPTNRKHKKPEWNRRVANDPICPVGNEENEASVIADDTKKLGPMERDAGTAHDHPRAIGSGVMDRKQLFKKGAGREKGHWKRKLHVTAEDINKIYPNVNRDYPVSVIKRSAIPIAWSFMPSMGG